MATTITTTQLQFDQDLEVDPNEPTKDAPTLDDERKKYGVTDRSDPTARLNLQHRIWKLALEEALTLAPIPSAESGKVKDVIDLGCGTGAWAYDLALAYPSATIVGVDLKPLHQTTASLPNLHFRQASIMDTSAWSPISTEDPSRSPGFDLIHCRSISSGISQWQVLVDLIWQNLRPGGWVELQEFHLPMQCDDGSLEGTAFGRWNSLLIEAAAMSGIDFGQAFAKVPGSLKEKGAVGVAEKASRWPIGPWAEEEKWKEVGRMFRADLSVVLGEISKQLFSKNLEWALEDVVKLWSKVEGELMAGKVHAYVPMHIVWAQKPAE